MPLEFIDSHTHLDVSDFDEDRDEVISRAFSAGVSRIVNIGATDRFEGAKRSLMLTQKYDGIYCSIGIHPHDAEAEFDIPKLKELASSDKVVAIGETGLDFFRDWSPQDLQYKWFRAQIELALEMDKPIIIHSRDAAEECYSVLKEMGAEKVGGVFHCYSEDAAFAEKLFAMNFIISVPGSVTFKKADALRDAVKEVPLDKLMIETDAPYLAPVPYRGKRCESSYVVETAKKIAEVKNLTLEEVAKATTQTAVKFYSLDA